MDYEGWSLMHCGHDADERKVTLHLGMKHQLCYVAENAISNGDAA